MEDLANEFSNYAMIEDIGSSAPTGLPKSTNNQSPDNYQSSKKLSPPYSTYKSKLSYSVNLSPNSITPVQISSTSKQETQPKTKHRYSTRSRSILLKSNSLALSDSESTLSDTKEGTSFFRCIHNMDIHIMEYSIYLAPPIPSDHKQPRIKKPKRKKFDKDGSQLYQHPYIPINSSSDQYYGKRKRSTTITQNSYESSIKGAQISSYANKLNANEFNNLSMQCDFDDKANKSNKFIQQIDNKMELDEEQNDSTSLSEESNSSDPRFFCDEQYFCDDEQSDYPSEIIQKKNSRLQYGRTSLDKTANPFSMLSSTSPSTSSLWKRRRRNLPNNYFN